MNWLDFFLPLWGLILTGVTVFIMVDARNAYDGDPATRTLSGYIKQWRRKKRWHSYLLAALIALLVLVPVYLFAHLVMEWI